jgi:hypothetical protein
MALTLDTLLEAKRRLDQESAARLSPFEQMLRASGAVHWQYVHYRVSNLVQAKGKDGAPVFYVVPNLGALLTHPDNANYMRECIVQAGYMALEIESVPLDVPTKAE